jgi:hypothetical protein
MKFPPNPFSLYFSGSKTVGWMGLRYFWRRLRWFVARLWEKTRLATSFNLIMDITFILHFSTWGG